MNDRELVLSLLDGSFDGHFRDDTAPRLLGTQNDFHGACFPVPDDLCPNPNDWLGIDDSDDVEDDLRSWTHDCPEDVEAA